MKQPASDPYFALVSKHWPHIVRLYAACKDKRPVMLYDVQEERIYAHPYAEFAADLSSARSRKPLKKQYEQAAREDKIAVFVRDNDLRWLVSYCLA